MFSKYDIQPTSALRRRSRNKRRSRRHRRHDEGQHFKHHDRNNKRRASYSRNGNTRHRSRSSNSPPFHNRSQRQHNSEPPRATSPARASSSNTLTDSNVHPSRPQRHLRPMNEHHAPSHRNYANGEQQSSAAHRDRNNERRRRTPDNAPPPSSRFRAAATSHPFPMRHQQGNHTNLFSLEAPMPLLDTMEDVHFLGETESAPFEMNDGSSEEFDYPDEEHKRPYREAFDVDSESSSSLGSNDEDSIVLPPQRKRPRFCARQRMDSPRPGSSAAPSSSSASASASSSSAPAASSSSSIPAPATSSNSPEPPFHPEPRFYRRHFASRRPRFRQNWYWEGRTQMYMNPRRNEENILRSEQRHFPSHHYTQEQPPFPSLQYLSPFETFPARHRFRRATEGLERTPREERGLDEDRDDPQEHRDRALAFQMHRQDLRALFFGMYTHPNDDEDEEEEELSMRILRQLNSNALPRGEQRNINPALLHLSLTDRDFDENDYELLLQLDETVEKKGVTEEGKKKYLTKLVPEESKGKCHICLEQMEPKEELLKVDKCTHTYHDACLSQWIEGHKTCPICRFEIPEK